MARCTLRILTAAVLLGATGLLSPRPATADVTVGGGSADFLLQTADFTQTDPPEQITYDPNAGGWQPVSQAMGGNLAQTPAVAYYPYYGQFHVVGLGTDGNLWDDYYTTTWVGWTVVPAPTPVSGGFDSAPAVALWNSQFHVFARGASTHHIYHAWYDPATGWNGWADISNAASATAPSASAYTGTGNRNSLHVFYLTDDGNRNMMQLIYNNPGSPNQWIGPLEQEAGP